MLRRGRARRVDRINKIDRISEGERILTRGT
jgi:hypothetical protein